MVPCSDCYDRRRHAAARTADYVFSQLIPYIGSKRKLLPLIREALGLIEAQPPGRFLDLFAGSGVVAASPSSWATR